MGGSSTRCKNCDQWYGAEDEEYGPCRIKHARGDKRYMTHGDHSCDEIYKDVPDQPVE